MKKLITAPLLTAALFLTGCGNSDPEMDSTPAPGDAQVETETEGKQPDKGGPLKDSPMEVLEKSFTIAQEGDLKTACEYVVIEEWELSEADKADGLSCVDAYNFVLVFLGSDDFTVDPSSGTQVDPSPYGDGTVLIEGIETATGGDIGCAVFTDKGNEWKWHILETIDGHCETPPMD